MKIKTNMYEQFKRNMQVCFLWYRLKKAWWTFSLVGSRVQPGWPVLWPHWDVSAQNFFPWFPETAHTVVQPFPAFPAQHTHTHTRSYHILSQQKNREVSCLTGTRVSLCVYTAWPGVWACMPARGGLGTRPSCECLAPSHTCLQLSHTPSSLCAVQPGCWGTEHSQGDLDQGHADASPESESRISWQHWRRQKGSFRYVIGHTN